MNCQQIRKALPAYLEGELSRPQAIIIEAHLAECPGCRLLAREIETINKSLSSLSEIEPSPALLAKIYSIPDSVAIKTGLKVQSAGRRERTARGIFSRPFWLSPAFQPVLVSLTIILIFISLTFFTQPGRNFQKSLSLEFHRAYSQTQKVLVKAGVLTDRINGYKESLLASLDTDRLKKPGQN
ncbi:MAG: zf-HC2 domain-containing protein [Acidobacteriota bacterium]|nr:zf-HC2 domain-containing protein [Acidobacteriota bacterium]